MEDDMSVATCEVNELIRVLLVEDHNLMRQGLKAVLSRDPQIIVEGEASSCVEAINLINEVIPDLVLLDVRLKEGNGIEVAKAINQNWPQVKVIVVTAYDDVQYVTQLARLGVRGYLLKTTPTDQLIRAIHDVMSGGIVYGSEVGSKLIRLLQKDNKPPKSHDQAVGQDSPDEFRPGMLEANLSPRETEVLKCIARGFKNAEIADALGISLKTVEVYIERILFKLRVRNRVEALIVGLNRGYLPEVPAGSNHGLARSES
jgi:DNA-binding NarL/FixJ family response regulator